MWVGKRTNMPRHRLTQRSRLKHSQKTRVTVSHLVHSHHVDLKAVHGGDKVLQRRRTLQECLLISSLRRQRQLAR